MDRLFDVLVREGATASALADILHRMDQSLYELGSISPPPSQNLLSHFKGQLNLGCATLLIKRGVKDQGAWRDTSKLAGILLLGAFGGTVVPQYSRLGGVRKVISGHLLKQLAGGDSEWVERVLGIGSNMGERLHKAVFVVRDQREKMSTSSLAQQVNIPSNSSVPTASDIVTYCPDYIAQYTSDLHMLVWLLARYYSTGKVLDLNFQLPGAGAVIPRENLTSLDLDSFLYAVVYCVGFEREREGPTIPPLTPNMSPVVTSTVQEAWWAVASKALGGTLQPSDRRTLQHGVDAIRCTGLHGLDINLTMKLGKTFKSLSLKSAEASENDQEAGAIVNLLEERAAIYYKASLVSIERNEKGGGLREPSVRLLQAAGDTPGQGEMDKMKEEASVPAVPKKSQSADSCEWDKVMHISDAEKSFRRKSNSKAVQTYFCAKGGLLARKLEAQNKGLMTWKTRDTAAERLSVGSMGTIEERICREWDLLDRIVEDDEKFVAIKRLTNILSNIDLETDQKTKAQAFHALCSIGLAPCVFLKENLLPAGENDFEAVVMVPTFISAVRMKGKMKKVIAEAKSMFLKDLQGKFKEDEEYFLDWLHLRIAERAEWGALDDKLEVVLQTLVPAYIDSIDGWRVYKPDWCPKNLHKKLKRDHIRWNEKKERNNINYWIAGCRMTDIGSELWTVSESVWPDLEEIIIARWMELLQDFPILGVDFEGGGCVGQFAFASQSGIATFVFIGGFFPTTLTRMIMDVSPIIIGGMFELSKYLGGSSGLSSLDPYVILRDVPGMNSSYGIADLAKVCLGLNLHRLKKVGAMCAKKQLCDLTMNELQYGFVRLSDWYQKEVLSNEQSYYAALDAEVLLRAIIMAMWLETALRQFSYTKEVITVSTVVEWWEWARDLKCNQSQLQRVSSTEAGITVRESRLAFLGKIHFFTHARGKEFSEEDRISDGGPLNETVGKENRSRALFDEHGASRSTLWKKRQGKREQEILKRRGK